jgi:phage tail sheath protein FI
MTAALVAHCEAHRNRVALLASVLGGNYTNDPPPEAQSEFAAFYAPWVLVPNPAGGPAVTLHPGGHIAGAIAANDANRGLWRAPANIPLIGITGLTQQFTAQQVSALSARGVNVLRNFPSLGNRIWGARTTSSDTQWQYLNVRRFLIYIEQSVQQGLQWAVFEPNGDVLWATVRQTVEDFLLNLYQQGALQGTTPQQAFFVRCDLTTMSQADLDNGQVNCLVGVAPLQPAEFVIFQIAIVTSNGGQPPH